MAGLIDRLPLSRGECVDSWDFGVDHGRKTMRDDVRNMLRSDKTREAIAEAVAEAVAGVMWADTRTKIADAAVRVLTGDGGNSREGC